MARLNFSPPLVSSERALGHRHVLWQSANQFVRIPKLDWRFAWGSLGLVMSQAGSYRHHVRDKAILLMNEETHRLVVLPYFTRFSEGYYRKAIRKLKGVRADRGVFLTLTIDPSRFTSLHQAYRELQRGWNKLLTMLRKRYGHLDFIKIPELGSLCLPLSNGLVGINDNVYVVKHNERNHVVRKVDRKRARSRSRWRMQK